MSDDEGADDSDAAFTNSIRGLIDSIREATPENAHDVAIESLMRALEGGNLTENLDGLVAKREAENKCIDLLAALRTGFFELSLAKGGTKIGKGVVLGRRGDYPEGKDCDGSVGGCKGGGDPIVEGGLWIARYKIIIGGGNKKEEPFRMVSKENVDDLITKIYDHKEYHQLLRTDSFPLWTDLFWSAVYHHCMGEPRGVELIHIFENICGVRDWRSIPGLVQD